VVGKGARAAGVTALARHTLRAAAIAGQSPTEMLGTLHQALHRQPRGADLCTVCLLVLRRAGEGAELNVALAGHEPPLVIEPGGECRRLGRPGTLLGVIDPIRINETRAELRPGETLLLFTDGVTEAGKPERQLGASGLRRVCREARELSLEGLLERIGRAAAERDQGGLHDDIALLAVRLSGDAGTGER
jgi:serine phosphatase RsbU (regulator of sigma subunit)